MATINWVETKQECEVGEEGQLIIKRVVKEPEKEKEQLWKYKPKEAIDLLLRFISIAAIAIPIILFYKGQQAERDRQKALFQLDVYSNATTLLHSLSSKPLASKDFDLISDKLLYEIYPKIVLLDDKEIVDTFNVVKDIVSFSVMVSKISKMGDSMNSYSRQLVRPDNRSKELWGPSKHGYFGSLLIGNILLEETRLERKIDDFGNRSKIGFIHKHSDEVLGVLNSVSKLLSVAISSSLSGKGLDKLQYEIFSAGLAARLPVGFEVDFQDTMLNYTGKLDAMMTRSSKVLYNQ